MRTPRVLGLDLSLTATGIADNGEGSVHTNTIRTSVFGQTTAYQRRRLNFIWNEIDRCLTRHPHTPELVVIEGPSFGSKGAGTWDRAGLWWLVVDKLLEQRLPIAVVPPAVLKKYATGRGNATKTDMAVALQKRADLELRDDNQVDAWWLAAAALQYLGHAAVVVPQSQRDALTKVTWPSLDMEPSC